MPYFLSRQFRLTALYSLTEVSGFASDAMRATFTHRIVVLSAMLTIAGLSLASVGCRKKSNMELGLSLVQAVRDGSAGEVRDLLAAADAADVNLIILESSSTPRQPGGRNWLWQRIEVKGLEEGLRRPRLADVLNAVGGSATRFVVSARIDPGKRTELDLRPATGLPRAASPSMGEIFMDAIGDITGRVVTARVQASLRTAARQRELDRRLVPFVPSLVQVGYGLALLLGVLGLRQASTWWARVWPPEAPEEYPNAFGYHSARAIRGAVFVSVFLPLVAVAAAPMAVLNRVRR